MQFNSVLSLTPALLGGVQMLEPGHGKTVVAARLVGRKRRKIEAVLLGLVVIVSHTFNAILLTVLAKQASLFPHTVRLSHRAPIVGAALTVSLGVWTSYGCAKVSYACAKHVLKCIGAIGWT